MCAFDVAVVSRRCRQRDLRSVTMTVAAVISLTERKSLRKIWSDCYFWSFPYYLVGAGVAGMMSWLHDFTDWQTSLLTLPVV